MSFVQKAYPLLLTASLFGCTTLQDSPTSSWHDIVYQGLDHELKTIELPDTIDCGYYDLSAINQKIRTDIIEQQFDCATKAISNELPFKLGHTWIPVDSKLTQIIISQTDSLFMKTIDIYLDGTSGSIEEQNCESAIFNTNSLRMEPVRCSRKQDEGAVEQ